MASCDAARGFQAAVFAAAMLCAAATPISVSPRLELPSSSSIGVAPRIHWVDEEVHLPNPAPATAVRAVLEVVVPTTSKARVVCVAGATGCASTTTTTSTTTSSIHIVDDDEPLIVVGTEDKAKDDAATGGGGTLTEDGGKEKVFFVDEDSIEDTIKDRKTKKKDKKTSIPIIISYDGWKGKTVDDIPVNPDRRNYNTHYDMDHNYSGLTAPEHYSFSPQPPFRTFHTNDIPATYWDEPPGSESTLLVRRLVKSAYPSASPPSYWRPPSDYGGYNWRPQAPGGGYPGGHRGVVSRRTFQPTPAPGFYGGGPPRIYPRSSPRPVGGGGGGGGVWCAPGSPGWPSSRPLHPPSTTTTPKPVLAVDDKLDFDDGEEDKKTEGGLKGLTEKEIVKIVGKVELDDW